MKFSPLRSLRLTAAGLSLASCLATTPRLLAGPDDSTTTDSTKSPKNVVIDTPPPESWIHVLLITDFSDKYITPRGLLVSNEGMTNQDIGLVFWDLYHSKDSNSFLNDITLTTGGFFDFDTVASGAGRNTNWVEFDPIAGIAYKFLNNWKLETNYTSFVSPQGDYPTSSHLQVQLTYNDSFSKVLSINPYVAYWQELSHKATVDLDNATSRRGYYFTVGIDPTIDLSCCKIEFPTYINLVSNYFYQQFNGMPGGDGIGVFGTEAKISVPLKFIPKSAGFWTLYAGVKYYHLSNSGVTDGNIALSNQGKSDLVQFHGGLTIFF